MYETRGYSDHESVTFFHDGSTGARAVIALHDTTLGPGLGGCRLRGYGSVSEGVEDVLRLSRAMTYKSAAAGLDLGGGKAVFFSESVGDGEARVRCMEAYGGFVESLGGRYVTAEDVGVGSSDIEAMARRTRHVVGKSEELGGMGSTDGPTVRGVFLGLKATVRHAGLELEGLRAAVQGLGKVGMGLCGKLHEAGVELTVADVNEAAALEAEERYGARRVGAGEIYDVEADVFSPCALGGVLNEKTMSRLRVKVVAGGANNQFADDERDAAALAAMGITHAPDYIINAGGVIMAAGEYEERGWDWVNGKVDEIEGRTAGLLERAREEGITPMAAALELARGRLEGARKGG